MKQKTVGPDERDAVAIILKHCAPELATIIAMHEEGCFLRCALRIALGLADMTQDQLLEAWVDGAMTSE